MPLFEVPPRGSFKRQVILTFVVGFFVLSVIFSAYMVIVQRANFYRDSLDEATGLANSLALSSLPWVLANDVAGLQEVVHSFHDYPELRYAMVVSPAGHVLAHSDAEKVGQFISDPNSLALIKAPPGNRVMLNDDFMTDVAVPISVNRQHVGWARIGLGREKDSGQLRSMMLDRAYFVLFATALSLLAALVITDRLGKRIGSLVKVADAVRAGNFSMRASIQGGDGEITRLASSFNLMLDTLALNEKELRENAARLKEAQQLAKLGAWRWDVASATHTWSDEIYSIYGRDPALPPADFQEVREYFTPESWTRLSVVVKEAVAQAKPYECDAEVVRPDGARRWITVRGEASFDANGKVINLHGTVHDITERKRVEEEVSRLNTELEQRVVERTGQLEAANKELEAFSYSVSHDLRTPLRAIDGFSRILLDNYASKLDEEGRRLLNVVRDNTRRMGQLIDDILKFSRAGRVDITFAEIDMGQLVRTVVEELQPTAAESGLQLEIEPLPPIRGDSSMMRQVFVNLLSNAIKFSRGKKFAMVRVGGHVEGNEAVYYVKDNGVGFDMQYVGKLFGVFQRLHGVAEFEGTGIGLAIVKRVVLRHGGRVWAESKVNEGTTIYFALPV